MAMIEPLYTLHDVGWQAEGRMVLQPLSLSLPAGQMVGLIGCNGSGKSTLLKLLARQLAPSRGTIRFRDRPLADWPHRDLARHIAYLPQHTASSDGLLVRELVALGRYPWHGALGRFRAEDAAAVDAAMTMAGVTAFADRVVDSLSGGERQRAWLAMLLAQTPALLLLDEPTAALDIGQAVDMLELLRRLRREQGLSIVVVLHDINMAARVCDTLLVLDAGTLIARGAPNEIVVPVMLKRIYGRPFRVRIEPDTGWPVSQVL
jgi:ferric hydroxamate transport system ATP-binding protein